MTKRVAIYARHSTDHQSPRSVEDQVVYCTAAAKRTHPDCQIVKFYKDSAISGASLDRPEVQAMLRDARKGLFEIVYFEDLTRLSRDMADATTIKKEFDFLGLEMWEANGGKLDTMRTGVQSLFGQLFREETARKVYRGMRPRAEEGLHMGGRPYGYKPLMGETRNIDDRGKLKIVDGEAKVIVRIFEERAAGKSPRLIAAGLNQDGILSPRGGKWNASTINGQKGRGVGIFHNELYVGRYRWNKLKFKKPPGSNKRVSVSKNEAEHVVVDVPEYRIVPQALWDAVQEVNSDNGKVHMSHRRTPRRLLSQLLKCPACNGGISSYGVERSTGKVRVGCSTHKESKSCPDPHTFYVEWIEETVVNTLKHGLADPAVINRAIKAYEDERRRAAVKAVDEKVSVEKRIADLTRKINRLNQMLVDEIGDEQENSSAVKQAAVEKRDLETRLQTLKQEAPDNLVMLQPPALRRYLAAVEDLRGAIERRALAGDQGPAKVIREFIEAVYVHGERDGKPKWVEVKGRLAQLFDQSAQPQSPTKGVRCDSSWGKGGSGGGI